MKGGGAIALLVLLLLGILVITSIQTVKDEAETSTEKVAMVKSAAQDAFVALGVEKPYPNIRIASRTSPMLGSRDVIANAVILDDGERSIYVNRSKLKKMDQREIAGNIWHEAAHHRTWEIHGFEIDVHGTEFRSICFAANHDEFCSAEAHG